MGLTDTVHKVSSGASLMIPYCRVGSLKLALRALKERGVTIYATEVEKEATSLKELRCSSPAAIVLGAEGRGVGKTLRSLADEKITISGNVSFESLNVSVAAGIILYQFRCQKPL